MRRLDTTHGRGNLPEREIPQAHCSVEARARQPAAIGRERYGMDSARMSVELGSLFPTDHVPKSYGSVPARRGQCAAVGGKGELEDQVPMPGKRLPELAVVQVPEADRVIHTRCGQ